MHDVLLIYPRIDPLRDFSYAPPLSLVYLATVLKQNGYKVKILDMRIDKNYDNIKKIVRSNNLIFVGISCKLGFQSLEAIKIRELVKKENPNLPVIFGGPLPTMYPNVFLKYDNDIVVRGFPENIIVDLTSNLEKNKNLQNIKSVSFKKNGQIIHNKELILSSLDHLPFPDYSICDDLNKYSCYKELRQLPIINSKGCPFRCSFCYLSFKQQNYLTKSNRHLIQEIQFLKDKFKCRGLLFFDENPWFHKDNLVNFCNLLIKNEMDIVWNSYFRVDNLGDNMAYLMSKSGCNMLSFGAESGSQNVLDVFNKQIKISQIIKSAELCNKYDIIPLYFFVAGYSGQTNIQILKTVGLIEKIKKICPSSEFYFSSYYQYKKHFDLNMLYHSAKFISGHVFFNILLNNPINFKKSFTYFDKIYQYNLLKFYSKMRSCKNFV